MKKIKVIRFSERANTKDHREAIFNAGNLKLAQRLSISMQLNIKSRRLITTPVYQIRSHKNASRSVKGTESKSSSGHFQFGPTFLRSRF